LILFSEFFGVVDIFCEGRTGVAHVPPLALWVSGAAKVNVAIQNTSMSMSLRLNG
jgi:hypothetical protein